MSATDYPQLPSYFPRAPSVCKTPSETFFTCINENSVKTSADDKEASLRGLRACVKQLRAYEECMDKYEGKKEPKRFRVQEEYRQNASLKNL